MLNVVAVATWRCATDLAAGREGQLQTEADET
jgi:hypothetical protein